MCLTSSRDHDIMKTMPRALDHLVLAYRDLDAAAERFRTQGFLVSPRNRHPWGTQNHVVQFDGAYLELIGLGPDYRRPAPEDPVAPFAGHVADFLDAREGLAMIALRSTDAETDARDFAAAGWSHTPLFRFERTGLRDGRERKLAFSLAFIGAEAFDAPRWFVCQHHHPENFWDAAAQVHPNGAVGVGEVGVAAAPDRLAELLGKAPTEGRFEGENAVFLSLAASAGTVTIRRAVGPALAIA
jgi:hypothetical protein